MAIHRTALQQVMSTASAISQLDRYRRVAITGKWDELQLLELMLTGAPTPEMRVAWKEEEKGSACSAVRKAEISKDLEEYKPLAPVQQLAWGTVKCIIGHQELQQLYETAKTRMPALLGRVVARAYSPGRDTVPPTLKNLRLDELFFCLKGREWSLIDLTNDADAQAVKLIVGAKHVERVRSEEVYADLWQLQRLLYLGASVWALFGVSNDVTLGWQRALAIVQHMGMLTGMATAERAKGVAQAARTFIRNAIRDLGVRVDLVRYSSRPDAPPVASFLAPESAPLTDFHIFVSSTQETLKRERNEMISDSDAAVGRCVKMPKLSVFGNQAPKPAKQVGIAEASIDTKTKTGSHDAGPQGKYTTQVKVCMQRSAPNNHETVYCDAGALKAALKAAGVEHPCIHGMFGGKSCCKNWNAKAGEHGQCMLSGHKSPAGVDLKKFVAPGTWPALAMER